MNSLRGRLLLLVLLALVPPMVLNLTGAWHERGRELEAAREDLQRMANLAAANEERFIEGTHQFLTTLADVPELQREPGQCSAFLNALLRKNDDYLNLGLIEPNGEVRCSARSTPLHVNVRDREYFQRALAQRSFVVSDYIYGRIFGMHTLNLTYPLLDEHGEVRGVLFASLNLQALDRFARDIGLPPEAVMVTADRDGTVLSQRPDPQQRRVGKPADRILRAAAKAQEAPIAEVTDSDGITRVYAFARVRTGDGAGFMLSVAIPRHSILAPANRQQAIEFLMLLLTAALVLGATWLVGDVTIVRRIQALGRAVGRIADGDFGARSGVRGGGAELDRLGQAVDRMAQALQEHERARSAAQARLFEEKERAQVTLASIGDAVITTDRHGRIEYMNPVAEALTGWPHAAGRGQPLSAVFHTVSHQTRAPVANPVEQALREGRIVKLDKDALLIARDGSEYAVEDSAAPISDRRQAVIGAVLVFRDVSQSRSLAVQLSHQASHDPLTGLVNRREFERRLQLALEAASSQERHYSVLYMDLDQFKIVNDTCGHGAGDDLLRQVTTLLQPLLRESDTLARLGGDEFGALLENCTPDAAVQIADKLRQTICDFHFVWRDRMFYIGVSIGIVNFHNGMLSLAEVLSAADSACYLAKVHGRNRLHVYHPEDDELIQRHGQMEWTGR
ncbi:MAG: diguanylate cyclase, partial [Burkholderiaceae bacterium]